MLDICAEEAQLRYALDIILLLQCLLQGTHPARSSLRLLPHLKNARPHVFKRLETVGVSSLPQVTRRRERERGRVEAVGVVSYRSLLSALVWGDLPRTRRPQSSAYICIHICLYEDDLEEKEEGVRWRSTEAVTTCVCLLWTDDVSSGRSSSPPVFF